MPATIQVVLQQDMPNLGKSGELVKVRPGYARNFLLPRQLALPATSENVARIEHNKAVAAARAAKAKADATAAAAKISAISVRIVHKAGEDGRLFGSVGAKDIAAALADKGVTIDKKKIHLAEPFKAVGAYEVQAKLAADVVATIKVEVAAG